MGGDRREGVGGSEGFPAASVGTHAEPADASLGGAEGPRLAHDRSDGNQSDAGRSALPRGGAARAPRPRRLPGVSPASAGPRGSARGARRRSFQARRSRGAGGPLPDGIDERVLLLPVQAVRRSGGRSADGRSLLSAPRQPGGSGFARAPPLPSTAGSRLCSRSRGGL